MASLYQPGAFPRKFLVNAAVNVGVMRVPLLELKKSDRAHGKIFNWPGCCHSLKSESICDVSQCGSGKYHAGLVSSSNSGIDVSDIETYWLIMEQRD